MGIRDRLKNKVKGIVDRFSGESSAAAPDEIKPFERNLPPNENVEVLKAKLERPRDSKSKK
ncbi:MAG: hypothetical protein VX899_21245 [Myxococcota bacterium]|nr:hypothetical protein [Myxococcota bacterium]